MVACEVWSFGCEVAGQHTACKVPGTTALCGQSADLLLQASQLAAWSADGVIVGSALVRALGEAATPVRLAPHAARGESPVLC